MTIGGAFAAGIAATVAAGYVWKRVIIAGARGERYRNWQAVRQLRRDMRREGIAL